MTDIYNIPYEINTIVDYDFYKDYLGHNHFKENPTKINYDLKTRNR